MHRLVLKLIVATIALLAAPDLFAQVAFAQTPQIQTSASPLAPRSKAVEEYLAEVSQYFSRAIAMLERNSDAPYDLIAELHQEQDNIYQNWDAAFDWVQTRNLIDVQVRLDHNFFEINHLLSQLSPVPFTSPAKWTARIFRLYEESFILATAYDLKSNEPSASSFLKVAPTVLFLSSTGIIAAQALSVSEITGSLATAAGAWIGAAGVIRYQRDAVKTAALAAFNELRANQKYDRYFSHIRAIAFKKNLDRWVQAAAREHECRRIF